ncbi:MAG: PadR family transcriptional regulator [Lachnospiraceae bacterium]|nr:PadR family transcriptional regulator [Lachnospiraceae bacterium]
MPREKFQTLTEQMFYILLCLKEECCGMDIMSRVEEMTKGRVRVGPGTLYHLLEQFQTAGFIKETKVEGRKRSYILLEKGKEILTEEYERLKTLTVDYENSFLKNVYR